MSGARHEVTIRRTDQGADLKAFVFTARCTCGWKAVASGESGEVRAGRKADDHLRRT